MPNYYKFKEEDSQQALFNSGIAKLERIHKIRLSIVKARYLEDYSAWSNLLHSFRSEVNERLSQEERSKANKYQASIKNLLYICSRHQKLCRTNQQPLGLLVNSLEEFELFLGDLEYKYGLSLPDKKAAGAGALA